LSITLGHPHPTARCHPTWLPPTRLAATRQNNFRFFNIGAPEPIASPNLCEK